MLKTLRRHLTRRPVLGLDMGHHAVKWAVVDTVNRVIESVGWLPTQGQAGQRPLWDLLPKGIRSLRMAIQGQEVAYGYLELPQLERQELATAVQAQAQRSIPFGAEQTHFSFCETPSLSQAPNQVGAFYVAARRSEVEKLTCPLQDSGFEISRVELPALALCREFLCNQGNQPDFVLLVHIGHRLTQVVVTRRGFPYFARDFATAGHDFIHSVAMGLQCTNQTAEHFLEAYDFTRRDFTVEPAVLRWLEEVQRSLVAAEKRLGLKISRVLLSGGGALTGLAQRLAEKIARPSSTDNWSVLRPERGEQMAWRRPELFKLAVGLALEV